MTEENPTWTLRHTGTTFSSKGDTREITLEVRSPSSLRPGYIYLWTGPVTITHSGHINISHMSLVSASQNQSPEVPPDIKKENQRPVSGPEGVEPNDLEATCERIALKCHKSTQSTEKIVNHLNLLREEYQTRKYLAEIAINDMLGAIT